MPRKKNPNPRPAHRPPINYDWQLIDEMLEAGCSGVQIAAYYNVHPNNFYLKFQKVKGIGFVEYSTNKKSCGDALLHLKQYKQALGTCTKKINTQLLLMLGEERLGQGKKKIDVSGVTADGWREIIQNIEADTGIGKAGRPIMEDKQSLLDQGRSGESDQVPDELGTERAMERSSPMQDSSESSSARNNDVFMPPFP